nr:MAG TPA: hypothetical protein [Caudoviricetes sp.]
MSGGWWYRGRRNHIQCNRIFASKNVLDFYIEITKIDANKNERRV